MLRSGRGLLCCAAKLEHGRALHTTAKDWLSSAASQDVQISAERLRAVFRTAESDPMAQKSPDGRNCLLCPVSTVYVAKQLTLALQLHVPDVFGDNCTCLLIDQANHGEHHEGRHYNIALQEVKAVFPHGLPSPFQQQIKTFNEACLMVRKPALELLAYLKSSSFANPAIRYVIYGEKGTGKTMTLCHVVHYCARQGWLVLHVPDAHLWVKNCRQLMQSSYKKERLDQPLQASFWLKNFKITNERFLKEIKTQQKYTWGKRESTEEGRPLGEVVEQGLARVKNASDAIGVVLKELKQQSGLGAFRLLVAVDGVNALWGRTTLKKEDKSPVSPEELTLVHNLRKMMRNDWTGGAIVTTLSQTGSLFKPSSAYLPHELLGKEGFDALDPFVPISVPNYSALEFESCYEYYLDRRWLQHENARTRAGRAELRFLSGANPRQLQRLAAPL